MLPPLAPGLVLECWKACTRSLLAVCSITGVVGMFFIPDEIERLSVSPVRSVRQCEALPGGSHFAVIESSIHPFLDRGTDRRLAMYERRGSTAYRTACEFPPDSVCLTSHPKGYPLFVARASGEICAVNSLSSRWGAAAILGRHPWAPAEMLACTADGRTLVSSDVDSLYVWDLKNWKLRWCMSEGEVACWGLHPDSRRLIACRFVGEQYAIQSLDLETAESTTLLHCPAGAWRSLQVGARGQTIVGVDADGWLRVFRQADTPCDWHMVPLPSIQPLPEKLCVLSPAENLIATALDYEQCIQIWNLQTGQPEAHLPLDYPQVPIGMRFLTDRELMAWGNSDLLWIWDFSRTARPDAIGIRRATSGRL
jgi:hypothetical protein